MQTGWLDTGLWLTVKYKAIKSKFTLVYVSEKQIRGLLRKSYSQM